MGSEDLIELTAQIVESHVSANQVGLGDLPVLIQRVHAALIGLGKFTPPLEEPQQPAVTIRASVKPDAITCLECGSKQKILKRHLHVSHDLTPADYRAKWKLANDYPMVAANYAEQRRTLAKAFGLGKMGSGKTPAKRKRGA